MPTNFALPVATITIIYGKCVSCVMRPNYNCLNVQFGECASAHKPHATQQHTDSLLRIAHITPQSHYANEQTSGEKNKQTDKNKTTKRRLNALSYGNH